MSSTDSPSSPGRSLPLRLSQGLSQRSVTIDGKPSQARGRTKVYFLHHNSSEEKAIADRHKRAVEEAGKYAAECLSIAVKGIPVEEDDHSGYAIFWKKLLNDRSAGTPVVCCVVSQVGVLQWPVATMYARDTPLLVALSPEGRFGGDLSVWVSATLKLSMDVTWVFNSTVVKSVIDSMWRAQDREICCGAFELIAAMPDTDTDDEDTTETTADVVGMIVEALSGTLDSPSNHDYYRFLHKQYQARGRDARSMSPDRLKDGDWPGILTKLRQLDSRATSIAHDTLQDLRRAIRGAVRNAAQDATTCNLALKSAKMAWRKVPQTVSDERPVYSTGSTNAVVLIGKALIKKLKDGGWWDPKSLKQKFSARILSQRSDIKRARDDHIGILQRKRRPSLP